MFGYPTYYNYLIAIHLAAISNIHPTTGILFVKCCSHNSGSMEQQNRKFTIKDIIAIAFIWLWVVAIAYLVYVKYNVLHHK
ncbi:hypothetical protein A4H97_11565 [Niastella yeongjuensis]|uniref:Uncharacterized protein n=1 Tax=Niastella yeongjuensis TaxID=354355 RepID=A0A1V9E9N1_9BACT|nr:hypothetical protein A4H97_11565 [Niastella yeongjuensis]SEO54226.1 hypothetical protein SAMN05660816_02981 [Niastella yeongjuensis]